MSKTSLILPVVSTQYRLVMDGWTDRQTERHTTTAHTALALRRAVKKITCLCEVKSRNETTNLLTAELYV